MTAANVSLLPTALTAEYWADRIDKAHAETVAGIVRIGAELIAAKAALPHGEWGRLTGHTAGGRTPPLLPFSRETATRLMQIGGHAALANGAHVHHLPASWGTLAVLARLPAPVVEQYLAEEVIHADLARNVAEQLVAEWSLEKRQAQPELIDAAASAPVAPPAQVAASQMTDEESDLLTQIARDTTEMQRAIATARGDEAEPEEFFAYHGPWEWVLSSLQNRLLRVMDDIEERLPLLPDPEDKTIVLRTLQRIDAIRASCDRISKLIEGKTWIPPTPA